MDNLIELEKSAIDAKEAFWSFDSIYSDLYGLFDCEEQIKNVLKLELSEDSIKFLKDSAKLVSQLNKVHLELQENDDRTTLNYALAQTGLKLGDVIDFVKHKKKYSMRVESASLHGVKANHLTLYGTRMLQSGGVGKSSISCELWMLDWKKRVK